MRKVLITLLTAASLLFPLTGIAQEMLQVRFFDVGKADCCLITFPDGRCVMIDAATNKMGKEVARRLRQEGLTKIDTLIITHFDKDHVGGADKMLESFEIGRVVYPAYPKRSKQHDQFMEALTRFPGIGICAMGVGERETLPLSDAVLEVSSAHRMEDDREENDLSLVTRMTFGNTRFLFAGDAEGLRLQELLEEGDLACQVLKVPHHGRAEYNSAAFLTACGPEIAWVPDSEEEPADPALIQYLSEQLGTKTFCGAEGQELVVTSDGEKVSCEEMRPAI